MRWYDSLLLYGLQPNETEESLRKDPDLKLIPLVIEKVVLPKLNRKYLNTPTKYELQEAVK